MSLSTPTALKARATAILTDLCITHNFDSMPKFMAPDIQVVHDDDEPLVGRDELLSHWRDALKALPGFTIKIGEQVAEVDVKGGGGKVWTFSRVTGLPGGKQKDSVDMLEFDAGGVLVKFKDVQRLIAV